MKEGVEDALASGVLPAELTTGSFARRRRAGWLQLAYRRLFRRGSELLLTLLGIGVGALAGVIVSAVSAAAHLLHSILFGVEFGAGLSGSTGVAPWAIVVFPTLAGLLTAVLVSLRRRTGPIVDPIEANAVYGGRMSLTDSIWVTLQNLASNGFGLSAGLEAAYTQLASGVASKLGLKLKLRREDMRILVGCGAAGGIAAAFGAPITGAFYAFELIIGTYSIVTLAPVTAAAITATVISSALGGKAFSVTVEAFPTVSALDFAPAVVLGVICAFLGILVMIAVVRVEKISSRIDLSIWLRPAIGGFLVGSFALFTPQVLSSGHGAMHLNLESNVAWWALVSLFCWKALCSAMTIGFGFRGGLFFASLLLGVLVGKAFALPVEQLLPETLSASAFAIVGMSALGVAVIGGPLTMTFLALEITGQFSLTGIVLASVITSSMVVRATFGYSFSTWRFHLRGESIRSAHDISWIRNLTVERLMRRDVLTAHPRTSPGDFMRSFPLGAAQRVVIVDDDGRYEAIVYVAEVHADAREPNPKQHLSDFYHHRNEVLFPAMNAKQAASMFEKGQAEALVVVSDRVLHKVVGLLTEAHTLRRYAEELDKQRRNMTGMDE